MLEHNSYFLNQKLLSGILLSFTFGILRLIIQCHVGLEEWQRSLSGPFPFSSMVLHHVRSKSFATSSKWMIQYSKERKSAHSGKCFNEQLQQYDDLVEIHNMTDWWWLGLSTNAMMNVLLIEGIHCEWYLFALLYQRSGVDHPDKLHSCSA